MGWFFLLFLGDYSVNKIDTLEQRIRDQFPAAIITVDRPAIAIGDWLLNCVLGNRQIVVKWRPEKGFSVSNISDLAATGSRRWPDHEYPDSDAALQQVVVLLKGD
jgi:hypothetical protein